MVMSINGYHEEEEEVLSTVGVEVRNRMTGGIIPSYLCWQNSNREETGIPISSRSERSVKW